MLRLEDVVIHMKANLQVLTKNFEFNLDDGSCFKGDKIFSECALNYLDGLSKVIFRDQRSKQYPDVLTFAFYCRKSNLYSLHKNYIQNKKNLIGVGLAFHIAPSNVPVNFAYSMIVGLLSGNANIIKVPSKIFEQVEIIKDAINKLSEEGNHKYISERIILVRYKNTLDEYTKKLSSMCNARLIWGGDNTINNVRKHALQPRSREITFSDRYSLCIINANKFISEKQVKKVVTGFYNDTFLFDQNACTSPHLIIWQGTKKNIEKSQNIFWPAVHELVKEKYNLQSIQAVDKLTAFYRHAINSQSIRLQDKEDNLIWRVEINTLSKGIDDFRSNGGYFIEYKTNAFKDIFQIVSPKFQTLAYYGYSKKELTDYMNADRPMGIDRIVPIGNTMDFSLVWDGYDLINSLSRTIDII